jgi:hypothetical protein
MFLSLEGLAASDPCAITHAGGGLVGLCICPACGRHEGGSGDQHAGLVMLCGSAKPQRLVFGEARACVCVCERVCERERGVFDYDYGQAPLLQDSHFAVCQRR